MELSPQDIVQRLCDAGWSQQRIAAAVGTTQPTINRIKVGKKENPDQEGRTSYQLVDRLRQLYITYEAFQDDIVSTDAEV